MKIFTLRETKYREIDKYTVVRHLRIFFLVPKSRSGFPKNPQQILKGR